MFLLFFFAVAHALSGGGDATLYPDVTGIGPCNYSIPGIAEQGCFAENYGYAGCEPNMGYRTLMSQFRQNTLILKQEGTTTVENKFL